MTYAFENDKSKKNLATVATSGSYDDLNNKPLTSKVMTIKLNAPQNIQLEPGSDVSFEGFNVSQGKKQWNPGSGLTNDKFVPIAILGWHLSSMPELVVSNVFFKSDGTHQIHLSGTICNVSSSQTTLMRSHTLQIVVLLADQALIDLSDLPL